MKNHHQSPPQQISKPKMAVAITRKTKPQTARLETKSKIFEPKKCGGEHG
jgi:hypothetical protein